MSRRPVPVIILALASAGCSLDVAPPDFGNIPSGVNLELQPFITTGLASPVFLTQPLNDGRIFVVEQPGRIRVVRNGALQVTPFLDISSRVVFGGERGLLSVAFHPQYATNRFFYVYFTGANGEIRIERFTTTTDPEVADPASAKLIISAAHSEYDNHNGGLVAFGPDGMLWAGLGDGGGTGDPLGNGQNPNSLLGSMLRIDVNGGDPYAIPASNPYVGQSGRRPEVWAKGLRNPWRFAFDAATGLIYIADVGEIGREEISVQPYGSAGLNYGWNIMEGRTCYESPTCDQAGLTAPILDYARSGGNCSVIGGYVYRGSAIPGLQGHYLYSDYCGGWLSSFNGSTGTAQDIKEWPIVSVGNVPSFGVDFAGEIYMIGDSRIFKIVAGN
jgi:glucose/arabinose dehydrogenase